MEIDEAFDLEAHRIFSPVCVVISQKIEMFSRFSETAKNSPFAAPFSVAKCSPEPTTQDRSSRIMAAPNIEGGKLENRHFSIVRCSLSLDR